MSLQDRTAIWMADNLAELVKENEKMYADLKILSEAILAIDDNWDWECFTPEMMRGYSADDFLAACSVANKYLTKGETE